MSRPPRIEGFDYRGHHRYFLTICTRERAPHFSRRETVAATYVLRSEDAAPPVIRYIINNPLRAGLVSRPGDYEFWGSQVYTRDDVLEFVQSVDEWVPEWKKRRV